jgi:Ca2+-binding EF-hand superfamily protein
MGAGSSVDASNKERLRRLAYVKIFNAIQANCREEDPLIDEELVKLFQRADLDHNGFVSRDEFARAADSLGVAVSEESLTALMR